MPRGKPVIPKKFELQKSMLSNGRKGKKTLAHYICEHGLNRKLVLVVVHRKL